MARTGANAASTLDTAGRASSLTEPGQLFIGLGIQPWTPELPPVLGTITPGGPRSAPGLKPGDRIVSADGETIGSWPEWVEFVRKRPGKTIEAMVERGGSRAARCDLPVERAETADGVIGRIGAKPHVPDGFFEEMSAVERYPVAAALGAVACTGPGRWRASRCAWLMRMITGDVSVRNISGPINIAQYAGYSASVGLSPFLSFLAVVSISLGILNLLPVPMLDGGQIAYQLAEAAKGSPLVRAGPADRPAGRHFLAADADELRLLQRYLASARLIRVERRIPAPALALARARPSRLRAAGRRCPGAPAQEPLDRSGISGSRACSASRKARSSITCR